MIQSPAEVGVPPPKSQKRGAVKKKIRFRTADLSPAVRNRKLETCSVFATTLVPGAGRLKEKQTFFTGFQAVRLFSYKSSLRTGSPLMARQHRIRMKIILFAAPLYFFSVVRAKKILCCTAAYPRRQIFFSVPCLPLWSPVLPAMGRKKQEIQQTD